MLHRSRLLSLVTPFDRRVFIVLQLAALVPMLGFVQDYQSRFQQQLQYRSAKVHISNHFFRRVLRCVLRPRVTRHTTPRVL